MDLKELERMGGEPVPVPWGELERALACLTRVEDVEALRARRLGAFGDWVPWDGATPESEPLAGALATLQRTEDIEGIRSRHVQKLLGWVPWNDGDGASA